MWKTKIKKVEIKPIQIHQKSEINEHRVRDKSKHIITLKKLKIKRGPSIKQRNLPLNLIRKHSVNWNIWNESHKNYRFRENEKHELRNRNMQDYKNRRTNNSYNLETVISGIRDPYQHYVMGAIGRIGGRVVVDRMEGGEELRDSISIAGSALHPFVETVTMGKRLHHAKSNEIRITRKLKRVASGSRIRIKSKKYTNKKESRKAYGGVSNGNSRNRMIQYFLHKSRRNDNGDNIGKLIKVLIMTRVSVVMKQFAGYIGGFLLLLVLLIAFTCLPVMLVVATIYNSPFAIFFPSLEEDETVMSVTSSYVQEFYRIISTVTNEHTGCDTGIVTYSSIVTDNYYDVMVVYMVKYGVGDTASIMNDTSKERLKKVFYDMCSFSTSEVIENIENEDGTMTRYSTLVVNILKRTYKDMILTYGFDTEEVQMLEEMMSPDNLILL